MTRERKKEETLWMESGWTSYVPLFNVSKASWGSQVDQSSASWEKFTVSSCPSTGNTNSPLNVRDNRSVKFRKHWRRSSAFIPVVRVSASLQQVVTGSLASWLRYEPSKTKPERSPLFPKEELAFQKVVLSTFSIFATFRNERRKKLITVLIRSFFYFTISWNLLEKNKKIFVNF